MTVETQDKPLVVLFWPHESSPNVMSGWREGLLDLRRMRQVLRRNGYTASYGDIQAAWEEYSCDEYCAAWLGLHDEDVGIVKALLMYLIPK